MKIVLLEDLGAGPEIIEENRKKLEELGHTFTAWPNEPDVAQMLERIRGAQALIVGSMPLPEQVIQADPELRFIDVAFTGVNQIPLGAAHARGIVVSNASGYATQAVAELCLGFMIDLLRRIPQEQKRCRAGGVKEGLVGNELRAKTVGIVGAGHIGRKVAALCRAFGTVNLAFNRSIVSDPAFDAQVTLEELLERADIVSIHLPLTPETRGMIGEKQLSLMKKSAFLINAARGPIVESDALAHALQAGAIAGAALDVFDMEPPLPEDLAALHTPNTIVTPHIGYATEESLKLRAEIAFENLYAWLAGKPVRVV